MRSCKIRSGGVVRVQFNRISDQHHPGLRPPLFCCTAVQMLMALRAPTRMKMC